jgi:hypothetical protein
MINAQDAYEPAYDDNGELLPTVLYDPAKGRDYTVKTIVITRDKPAIRFPYLFMTLAAFIFGILIGRFLV